MISVAVSVFNVEKMAYDWKPALENFLAFGDELVVSINKSEDNTQQLITDWKAAHARQDAVRLIVTDFSDSDPEFYGKTQNSAVQNCTQQFIVLVDLDEKLLTSQRPQWERLALEYIQKDKCDAILIPSINLWSDELHAKDINQKWYIQRQGVSRGVVNFARRKDGTHDIEKSDGGEPLVDKNGTLARSLAVVPPQISPYEKIQLIKQNDLPYVLHYGGENFDLRIKRNTGFWKQNWEIQSGAPVENVATTIEELQKIETFEHSLKLKDEQPKLENES